MDIMEKINLAFKHFQEGRLEQAEKDCLEILAIDPANTEVLHLFGVTSHHLGAPGRAVEYLNKALQQDAENPDYFYDLGNVYHEQGNLDEALRAYQRALEIEPDHENAHNNIGMIFHDIGQLDEAISHYNRALELTPQSAMIHNNLGLAYQDNEEVQKAIAHFGRAIQLEPNYADAHFNMGNIFLKEDNPDAAYQYYFKSLQLNPNLIEAHAAMANILLRNGRFAEAVPLLSKVLMFYPDSPEIHNNLGNALSEIWQLDDAISHLGRAVELEPDFAEAFSNLGNTLGRMGNTDEAIKHINRALELNPELVEALNNLGTIYRDIGEFREAENFYIRALLLDPDNADSRFNRALIDLMRGNFRDGWEGYELRWKLKSAQEHKFPQPLWNGEPLHGKTLFVNAEQGIGDEIMFASCLHDIMGQARLCIVESDERLMPLFERSFAGAKIIKRLDANKYPRDVASADYRIPVGSLPRFLRPDIKSFPAKSSYLLPDGTKLVEWKERCSELGDGLKIGISWRGGSSPDVIRVRSAALKQWSALFAVSGVHFVNLQYGDNVEELKKTEEDFGVTICDWEDSDPFKDLDGFAAQIAALDLVISADNATVHLAGALGIPVWVLLPSVCDWRWMQDFEDTPWYESVRLFRQEKAGEWGDVLGVIGQRLAEAAKQKSLARETLLFPVKKSYKTSAG